MAHKILIIDDEQINTTIVKFGLSEKRYDVSTAKDGQEGLDLVKQQKPDLIILDAQMPNMNGYEFVGEIKRVEGAQNIPIIMLTANETMEGMFKLEGVKEYFVKPVKMPELVAKIVSYLGENPL